MLILIHTKFNNSQFIHTVSSDKRYKDSSQLMLTYDRFTNNQIKYALRRYLAKNNIRPIQSEDKYDILLGGKIKRPRRNKYVENPIIFYKHIIAFANSYDFEISTPSQLIIYPNQLPEGIIIEPFAKNYIEFLIDSDIVRKYYEIKEIDERLICKEYNQNTGNHEDKFNKHISNDVVLVDYNLTNYIFNRRSIEDYMVLIELLFNTAYRKSLN